MGTGGIGGDGRCRVGQHGCGNADERRGNHGMIAPLALILTILASAPGDLAPEPESMAPSAAVQSLAEPDAVTPPPASEEQALTEPGAADLETADLETIVITSRRRIAADPLEDLNVKTFAAALAVDATVIRPASLAYASAVPEPVRMGVRNFFRNLHEPVVFLNFLLQLRPVKAVRTLGRFALNSTVGVAGLFDMAKRKPFHLPYRPNGFANTLALYGVKPGAFLFLPLIGPTTVRDLVGLGLDTMTMPISGAQPITGRIYTASATAMKAIDGRAEGDEALHQFVDGNPNSYGTIRDAYLARRQAEIDELRGTPRVAKSDMGQVAAALPAR